MKAFRYRLERLLNLAAAQREERARALAEARQVLRAWEQRWTEAQAAQRSAQEEWRNQAAGGTHLEDWLAYQAESEARLAAQRRAADEVAQQQGRVDEKRGDYLDARRDERLLESLRVRARERWATEARREEQKTLDDVASAARAHRRKGGETDD